MEKKLSNGSYQALTYKQVPHHPMHVRYDLGCQYDSGESREKIGV